MLDTFAAAFSSTFLGVLKISIILVLAGLMVRRKFINADQVKGLSDLTVKLFLPCMIFSNITRTFDPNVFPGWWVLPLAGVGMVFFGLAASSLLFMGRLREKRNMLAVASVQNAGYLVLPLGQAIYGAQFDQFALYCFLFILGYSPVLWSLGKVLATSGSGERLNWRSFITIPFMASVVAIAVVFMKATNAIPVVVGDSIDLMGTAAVPIATFVLGAALGGISLRLAHHAWDAVRALAVKLVLMPLAVVVVLHVIGLRNGHSLLAAFLVIEGASAPATGLILQVKTYGGDEEKMGSVVLLGYIACIITIPFWVAVWDSLPLIVG